MLYQKSACRRTQQDGKGIKIGKENKTGREDSGWTPRLSLIHRDLWSLNHTSQCLAWRQHLAFILLHLIGCTGHLLSGVGGDCIVPGQPSASCRGGKHTEVGDVDTETIKGTWQEVKGHQSHIYIQPDRCFHTFSRYLLIVYDFVSNLVATSHMGLLIIWKLVCL